LKEDEWKFDTVPEIFEGMNVADYIDPDILERLEELEKEEEEQEAIFQRELEEEKADYQPLTEEEKQKYQILEDRIILRKQEHTSNKTNKKKRIAPRSQRRRDLDDMAKSMAEHGIDPTKAVDRVKRSRSRSLVRGRSLSRNAKRQRTSSQSRERSFSMLRSVSKSPAPGEGYKDLAEKVRAEVIDRKQQSKRIKRFSRKGEGDRTIPTLKPKHLFSGKRGIGKTQRR